LDLQGLKMLVVEDSAVVALSLEMALEEAGCLIVGTAADVEPALRLLEEAEIDVVVLDLKLAGSSALPIADVLVARDLPFVFTTGHERDTLPERFRAHLMCLKPFTSNELLRSLQEAIGIRLSRT